MTLNSVKTMNNINFSRRMQELKINQMKTNESILLVEDDIVDQMTVQRALKDIQARNPLYIVNNGEEALDFLKSNSSKIWIILLDLNMPKMNGIEFLKIVKRDDLLKSIPVVVLTTSKQESDIIESYNLGVAGFMIKPVDYPKYVEVVKTINTYWQLCENPVV
jgi:CheY-like chemotaxis protein